MNPFININKINQKSERFRKQALALKAEGRIRELLRLCAKHAKTLKHYLAYLFICVMPTLIDKADTPFTLKPAKRKKPAPVSLFVSADPKSIPCINFV